MSDTPPRDPDGILVRALADADHEAVVRLDEALGGTSRRGFFEKRWQAMARHPEAFTALGALHGERLHGFVLAQVLHGEFGTSTPVAVVDALGVAAEHQSHGIGGDLLRTLVAEVRALGAREVRTQIAWDQSGLQKFFARSGFALAPRQVLERTTDSTDF